MIRTPRTVKVFPRNENFRGDLVAEAFSGNGRIWCCVRNAGFTAPDVNEFMRHCEHLPRPRVCRIYKYQWRVGVADREPAELAHIKRAVSVVSYDPVPHDQNACFFDLMKKVS